MTPRPRPAPRRGAVPRGAKRLERLQQLRVLAHPLRLRLLELFALGPSTTKQAAERLGEPPTRLYHHVYAMERAGLLRLTGTRPNRGTVEKYFEAVAHRFEFDPGLFAHAPVSGRALPAVVAAAGTVADALRADLAGMPATVGKPGAIKPIVARAVIHADAARIREIREQLVAFLKRLGRRPRKSVGGESRRYALTLALVRTEPLAGRGVSRRRRER